MDKTYKIDISYKTIIFTVLFLISLKFAWVLRDLFFSLLIAFIVMSALKPPVAFLEKKKIPKLLSSFIILFFFISIIIYFFASIIPMLVVEINSLVRQLPLMVDKLNPSFSQYLSLDSFNQYLPDLTNKLFSFISSLFSNIVFVISTVFFSFYFIIEESFLKKFFVKFFKEKDVNRVVDIFEKIEKRMSAWFWGEMTLMFVVGVMTFIGLNLIGIKYAVSLAILAGLFEAIPNLGPALSAVPAFLVAVTQSYFLGFSVIALYFIVQQFENNLIVPIIMKKAVGLNPIITLIALIVGGKFGGILGIILAIPLTLFVEVIVLELFKPKQV